MASSPARGDLTSWLRGLLSEEGLTVGIVEAPTEGGWNDDPQSPGSYFTQYIVITPMNASAPTGSLGDPGHEWNFPYSIDAVGALPSQVEGQADKARRIINEIGRTDVVLGDVGWRVIDARINSVGGVIQDTQVRPPEFIQRDTVLVRISKRST